ncbi:MAG: hypothetical protein M1823_000142 [Watsoniomyces obsoletus]|nr:MAG: hypothetical protein M1823_000142 [Watsoniomyces obsoletus]
MSTTATSAAYPSTRYRPVVLFITGLAAAYGIYIIHTHLAASASASASTTTLRRSNAVHRRRRTGQGEPANVNAGEEGPSSTTSAPEPPADQENPWTEDTEYGSYLMNGSNGVSGTIALRLSTLPTADVLASQFGFSPEIAEAQRATLELRYIMATMRHWSDAMTNRHAIPLLNLDSFRQALQRRGFRETWLENLDSIARGDPEEEAVRRAANEPNPGQEMGDENRSGQRLLNLLYHIAEDQSRRDGYIHRGVTCNSCNTMPIRGVRYRCANCFDFDLCEICEGMSVHPRSHLFYKIRVPAPFLANPKHVQPVWYPGKPSHLPNNIPKSLTQRLVRETGMDDARVDALYEQFTCLAATEWLKDPNDLGMAIDRKTFDKCFHPVNATRVRRPQLIYDRLFCFYDVNSDGLIGFEEFLKGIAALDNKNEEDRLRRIFHGYDIDGDGYVQRRDFLRIFRAYYALTRELTEEMALELEDDDMDESYTRQVILGNQPISSLFKASIPYGERRDIEGKGQTANGDLEIIDDQGVILESGDNTMERKEVIDEVADRIHGNPLASASDRGEWNPSVPESDSERNELRDLALGREAAAAAAAARPVSRDIAVEIINSAPADGQRAVDATTDHDQSGASEDAAEEEGPLHPDDKDVYRRSHDDRYWPPDWITPEDVEAALGSESRPAGEISLSSERVKVVMAAQQRMEAENQRKREEWRQQEWENRWRRRQFYVDEEEGLVAPEGFEGDDNNEDSDNDDDSDSEPASHLPSPHSRSSSRVRFQDHLTDAMYETRSNHSTSSRSIPYGERWGGYEIPEAEKDVGREILYQVTQQGLNELLDPLFREKEDLALEVLATKDERRRYYKQTCKYQDQEVKKAKDEDTQRPLSLKDLVMAYEVRHLQPPENMDSRSTFDRATAPEVLSPSETTVDLDLLEGDMTGDKGQSSLNEDKRGSIDDGPQITRTRMGAQRQTAVVEGGIDGMTSSLSALITTVSRDGNDADEYRDPTLPQNRPDHVTDDHDRPSPTKSAVNNNEDDASVIKPLLTNGSPTMLKDGEDEPPSGYDNPPPNNPAKPENLSLQGSTSTKAKPSDNTPSESRLKRLQFLNEVELEMKKRGGPGRLNFEEFRDFMKSPAGKRLAFMGTWVEMASF